MMEDNWTKSLHNITSHSDDSDKTILRASVSETEDQYQFTSPETELRIEISAVGSPEEKEQKLNDHLAFYEQDEKQDCDICKESVPRASYKTHLETHNAFMMYECDLCQKMYKTIKGWKKHNVKFHSDKLVDTLYCSVCSKYFDDESSLIEHREKHNRERPYVCHICEKDFASRKNFRLHYRRHQESKPYVCDVCNRGFILKCQLRTHMITHSGDNPYVCSVCTRGFNFLPNFNRHMITHSEGKVDQHECAVCCQKFDSRYQLRDHMLSHPSEKRFPCDICLMSFATVTLLKRHYCTHTGEKPHSCHTCNLGFVQKVNLQRHYKTQKHIAAVKESASS